MKQDTQIYTNVSATSKRDEGPGSGQTCGYRLVIFLSVFLFLSLMANGILTYFYCGLKQLTVTSNDLFAPSCSVKERQIQYKDRLYIFPPDEMTWISSREKCQELGGDLLIINSKDEHKFLVGAINMFSNSLHWVGLSKAEKEAGWLWVDETPLTQNLSWWRDTGQDNTPEREDCVGYYDGQWVDISCSTRERRICEIICTH